MVSRQLNIAFFINVLLILSTLDPFNGALASEEDDTVARLVDNFWNWRLETSPEFGTKYGVHTYDNQVEQYTQEAFDMSLANVTQQLEEIQAIDQSVISKENKINLKILEALLTTYKDGYEYRHYSAFNYVSPLERPLSDWSNMISRAKFANAEDYRKLNQRYGLFEGRVEQIMWMMNEAIERGTTLHSASLTGVVESLTALLDQDYMDSFFYAPYTDDRRPDTIEDTEWEELKQEASDLIQNQIYPQIEVLKTFIEDDYAPNTRPDIACTSLEGGLEFYKASLAWHLSTEMSIEDLRDLGQREVDRIWANVEAYLEQENATTLTELTDRLNQQEGVVLTSEDEIFAAYEALIARIRTKLDQVVTHVPEIPLTIQKIPNPNAPFARYTEPPIDGSGPGIFKVRLYEGADIPKYTMMAVTLHESLPGHHLQTGTAIEKELPNFRRAIEYRKYNFVPFNWMFHTAYIEGWALYCEFLGEELGLYDEPYSIIGRYSYEMLRAARIVIDTGLHNYGWTREEAVEYITTYTTFSEEAAWAEVNRYVSWPGQACSYKIGELKIKELRQKAQDELGDAFDVHEFHEQVLLLGPAPLSLLESAIDEWIEEEKMNVQPNTAHTTGCHHVFLLSCIFVWVYM